MSKVRIVLEYSGPGEAAPVMRWERSVAVGPTSEKGSGTNSSEPSGTFELLGRAFEVAQREQGGRFRESLAAFFKGALVRKEDVLEVLPLLEQ